VFGGELEHAEVTIGVGERAMGGIGGLQFGKANSRSLMLLHIAKLDEDLSSRLAEIGSLGYFSMIAAGSPARVAVRMIAEGEQDRMLLAM